MKVCQHCGATYREHVDFCFNDGEVLVAADAVATAALGAVAAHLDEVTPDGSELTEAMPRNQGPQAAPEEDDVESLDIDPPTTDVGEFDEVRPSEDLPHAGTSEVTEATIPTPSFHERPTIVADDEQDDIVDLPTPSQASMQETVPFAIPETTEAYGRPGAPASNEPDIELEPATAGLHEGGIGGTPQEPDTWPGPPEPPTPGPTVAPVTAQLEGVQQMPPPPVPKSMRTTLPLGDTANAPDDATVPRPIGSHTPPPVRRSPGATPAGDLALAPRETPVKPAAAALPLQPEASDGAGLLMVGVGIGVLAMLLIVGAAVVMTVMGTTLLSGSGDDGVATLSPQTEPHELPAPTEQPQVIEAPDPKPERTLGIEVPKSRASSNVREFPGIRTELPRDGIVKVVFETVPDRATVTFAGETEETPCAFDVLGGSTYNFEILKEGYEPLTGNVEVPDNQTRIKARAQPIRLQRALSELRAPASLTGSPVVVVENRFYGCGLLVDGKAMGQSEIGGSQTDESGLPFELKALSLGVHEFQIVGSADDCTSLPETINYQGEGFINLGQTQQP